MYVAFNSSFYGQRLLAKAARVRDSQVRIKIPISFVVLLYIIHANGMIIHPWLLHFMYIRTTITPIKKATCIAYISNMCG